MMELKVCDEEGYPLTFFRALGRNFCILLTLLSLGAGYYLAYFNKKKQTLHDKMVGTVVVSAKNDLERRKKRESSEAQMAPLRSDAF